MYPTTVGGLRLNNCIYNAAGVWDTTKAQLDELANNKWCGGIVTKSITVDERKGNEYPKYYFADGYSINSNGLENKGFSYYKSNKPKTTAYFYSIGGLSNDERKHIYTEYQHETGSGIELNLSCPNLGNAGPAYNPHTLEDFLQTFFEKDSYHQIGLKLPPYYFKEQFEDVGEIISQYPQIKFITCINSIPNCLDFDINNNIPTIKPHAGYGGLGGKAILSLGLANVNRFSTYFISNKLDIDIVGCGGVTSGQDVYKYLLAGANAVQVGTYLWENGPNVFESLTKELDLIMKRKGYYSIAQVPVYNSNV